MGNWKGNLKCWEWATSILQDRKLGFFCGQNEDILPAQAYLEMNRLFVDTKAWVVPVT